MNHCQQLGKPLSIFERGCSRVRDSRLHQQRVRCRLPPTNRTTNNYFVPFLFFLFYLRKIMMHYENEHFLWNFETRTNFFGTILIKRIYEITSLFAFLCHRNLKIFLHSFMIVTILVALNRQGKREREWSTEIHVMKKQSQSLAIFGVNTLVF